jgi:hypothetical protein
MRKKEEYSPSTFDLLLGTVALVLTVDVLGVRHCR